MPATAETKEDADPTDTSPLSLIRNIGVAAHIDAGKTTTTERILYYTGKTHKMGDVDDGTTATDFDTQEQQRGITIFSAAVTCPWRDYTVNLIDTPGHVDFTAEVERCLRVLDGAIIVFDSKEGVEAQSETVWRQATKYNVPRICFLNKMDKIGADFYASIESIVRRLHANPIPVQIPIGADSSFEGVIDLFGMRAYRFLGDQGEKVEESDIPSELQDDAEYWRRNMIEKAAEFDDALMEKYLEDAEIPDEDIKRALRKGTIANKAQPCFCGSSLKRIGVQRLLDGVVDYLPSPLDVPPVPGVKSADDQTELTRKPSEKDPLAAYIFKIVAEKPLDLYYLRIYSGVLKSSQRAYIHNTGKKENISRLYRMFAKRREAIDRAVPGDIVAVTGFKEALTGDTVCDPNDPILLGRIEFPQPVMAVSVEPKNTKDKDALADALIKLEKQDPTFKHRMNEDTGQVILSGMGELHLEVLAKKLENDFNVGINVGKPLVAYRETITGTAEHERTFELTTASGPQKATVKLRVEAFEPETGAETYEFRNELPEEVGLKREFLAAIKQGIKDCLFVGPLAGYPLLNVRATLLHAAEHESMSTDLAFENAARAAFEEAVDKAGPVMLEPMMKLEVAVPDDYFGPVSGDLSARRGLIQDTEMRGADRVIHATVPLAEMFQYATKLRTLTQGRSSWSMEPDTYAAMPPAEQKELLKKYGYGD